MFDIMVQAAPGGYRSQVVARNPNTGNGVVIWESEIVSGSDAELGGYTTAKDLAAGAVLGAYAKLFAKK